MNFGTFYDSQGTFFDMVHFPEIAGRYPFRGRGFYAIKGRVAEDFEWQRSKLHGWIRYP